MIVNKDKQDKRNYRFGDHSRVERGERDENQSFHVKHSKPEKLQIVSGMRPVMEAIAAGKQIDKIMLQSNLEGQLAQELKAMIREAGLPVQYVPAEKLNRMTDSNHQGVVATISPMHGRVCRHRRRGCARPRQCADQRGCDQMLIGCLAENAYMP